MPKLIHLLPLLVLLQACSTLRESASVKDGVYDVPGQRDPAPLMSGDINDGTTSNENDYYDSREAARSSDTYRDYYDMTYNDPYYYNYGRFGFGAGVGSYFPAYGMGFSYGWPTSYGSMSVGYRMGYYSPVWGSSWGVSYGYDPYGYYSFINYDRAYGTGPYQNAWGNCIGCYEPTGYTPVIYAHRPSLHGGSSASGSTTSISPPMMRDPASLLSPANPPKTTRSVIGRVPRMTTPSVGTSSPSREHASPSRNSIGVDGGSRSGGTSNGGRISSPRPR